MIKAAGLTKRFGDTLALDNMQTTIENGSIYGLVGPNGSGKSTLMRMIAGVYRADSGTLTVDEKEVWENTAVKDRIFYLSDDLYFPPKTTVDEMARFYRGLYSSFSEERYAHLKTVFPIDCKKRISTFSKGQRRQAALMLALSCCCEYLLLDEAFDGLDVVIRLMIKKLLVDDILDRGMTVIVTSHNLRELEDLCDHVGLLHNGSILFEKELDSLKFGCCKVQAAYDAEPDWEGSGLNIIKKQQKGKLVSMLVRGSAEDTLAVLESYKPLFAEAVPLTLEEVFIAEMEAVGYDYNNVIL